ncbi:MAG: hypothetical protein N2Z62_00275 [Rhodobacteraceae bacterium]|nr:hypothetical protein [Paracoccaceae bacterium]
MAARKPEPTPQPFNILIVAQRGRLEHEAVLFAASLRRSSPGFAGRLIVAEPQPGPLWPRDPRIGAPVRALLADLGAEIRPFESRHFGAAYPYGNKIEALALLPPGEPFAFFDTDTLVTGDLARVPFPWGRPSASMRREGTWPVIEPYGPGYGEIWRSLHERFGLDYESSLDLSQPDEHWERYLYFNAGWFFGADPAAFGERFLRFALAIRDDPPPTLVCQSLDPWLDQVALPLVIHSLGGGRPGPELAGLDGEVTCHWRVLSLLYAREGDLAVEVLEEIASENRVKRVLKDWEPARRLIYQRRGRKARMLFDRANLPRREQAIRNRLKAEGLWLR